ncbi:MAG: lamin tail domain-containing protein [Flavobacteriales bacterium]
MGTVSSTTAIATHDSNNGFQNSAAYAFTGTGDVRTSTASSGYTGASGAGNVFLTTATPFRFFMISGIVTTGYTDIALSFGAHKNINASDLTELVVEYSTDGTNWSPLTFPAQAVGTGTSGWRLITITGGTIPAAASLSLRWTNTASSNQPRLDDILLTGMTAAGCGITLGAVSSSCDANTAGVDSYTLSIPYTGSDVSTSVVNGSGSGSIGGDDPASMANGTILITGITEGSGYSVSFTGNCSTLSESGPSPVCAPPPPFLAAWDFTGESSVATSAAEVYNAGLDASNLMTRGASATASSGANSFRTTGFQNNGIATSNTDYFEITLSAGSGSALSLTSLDARVTGTSSFAVSPGVSNQFAYSLDGSTFTLIGSPAVTVGANQTFNVDLSGITALQGVPASATITLRYYASGQTTTGGWGFFSDNPGNYGLSVTGALTPASGCGISLGAETAVCNGLTAGIDTYDLNIPYTGLSSGVTINYGGSGSVGGDDPNTVPNGTIVISSIDEGEAYNITFSSPCDALTVSGSSPACDPPACAVTLGIATATCNTITSGTGDTYDVSIPYSGVQPGTTVVNGSASGTIGGDDPAVVSDGMIVISGISETDGYTVSLTSPCEAQAVSGPAPNCDPPPAIKINEIDYDNVGTDDAEWIELYNADVVAIDLAGFQVRLINGSNQSTYGTYVLPAFSLAAGDYYVIGNNAAIPNIDLVVTPSSNMIQNGAPDGVVLYSATNVLLDALSYEGDLDAPNIEGTGTTVGDDNSTADLVLARVPNGADSDDNSVDWAPWCATPGTSNDNAPDADLDGTPDCLDTCPLAVDGITEFDIPTCSCNAGFDPVTTTIGPNTVITDCVASSCDVLFGTITTTCNSVSAGPADTYDLAIAYSGSEPGVTVINNSGSGTIGGDDPATVADGTIIISGISESDAYSVTLSSPCFAQVASGPAAYCEPLPTLVINEVDYDETGTDMNEFVEIMNTGAVGIDLTGMKLILVNGSGDVPYGASPYVLNPVILAPGDLYVIGSATVPNVDQIAWTTNGLQNGSPDGLRLTTADDNIIDQMSYEGDMSTTEGSGAGSDLGGAVGVSLSRIPNGTDTDDNSMDFVLTCSTPGAANTFPDADNDGTVDCLDVCPGGPEPGTPCDDLNASTGNDVIQGDCSCAGVALDCNGIPGGPDVPGAPCDDLNANTVNDVYQMNCTCLGELIDCLGTPGGSALPGTPCNDFDPNTFNDVYGVDCVCAGSTCNNDLFLEFQSDVAPGGVSWEVLDGAGAVTVLSGNNPIPANSIGTQAICLADGCYRLRVTDAAGDGITGYELRESGANGRRIIDNTDNMITGASQIANGGTFCLPMGDIDLIYSSCDKLDWVSNKYLVCHADPAVSAIWVPGGPNNVQSGGTGYAFWIFDPNGTYSFRRFRAHNSSDGFSPATATRACHLKVNGWNNTALTPHIPEGVLMNVRVRPVVTGTLGEWGATCTMKLDAARAACPLVNLQDDPANTSDYSCGVTRDFGGPNSSANKIVARPPQFQPAPLAGGTGVRYQFRFRIPGEGVCIVRPPQTSPTLYLNWNANSGPQLEASRTYEVEVRVSKDQGATWCVDAPSPSCDPGPVTTWGKTCNVTISGGAPPPTPTCSDGIQNGDEEGIDCGGSCPLSCEAAALQQGPGVGIHAVVHPNPNNGEQLFISLTHVDTKVKTVSVDIHDLTGQRVIARTIAVQDGFLNTALDLNGEVASGLYMLNITAGDKTYTERLVIQK